MPVGVWRHPADVRQGAGAAVGGVAERAAAEAGHEAGEAGGETAAERRLGSPTAAAARTGGGGGGPRGGGRGRGGGGVAARGWCRKGGRLSHSLLCAGVAFGVDLCLYRIVQCMMNLRLVSIIST